MNLASVKKNECTTNYYFHTPGKAYILGPVAGAFIVLVVGSYII